MIAMLQKMNKHTVLKVVREQKEWKGYIAPNKVNSYHINGGWCIGHNITIVSGKEVNDPNNYYVFHYESETYTELETYLNRYSYHNCNSELGNRVSFWVVL